MAQFTRALPSDAGCWVDDRWGHYAAAHMIEVAESFGYDDAESIERGRSTDTQGDSHMKSTKIRAGLYKVTNDNGATAMIEQRQSSPEWSNEWLWYITDNDRTLWLDPVRTKREAMHIAAFL